MYKRLFSFHLVLNLSAVWNVKLIGVEQDVSHLYAILLIGRKAEMKFLHSLFKDINIKYISIISIDEISYINIHFYNAIQSLDKANSQCAAESATHNSNFR